MTALTMANAKVQTVDEASVGSDVHKSSKLLKPISGEHHKSSMKIQKERSGKSDKQGIGLDKGEDAASVQTGGSSSKPSSKKKKKKRSLRKKRDESVEKDPAVCYESYSSSTSEESNGSMESMLSRSTVASSIVAPASERSVPTSQAPENDSNGRRTAPSQQTGQQLGDSTSRPCSTGHSMGQPFSTWRNKSPGHVKGAILRHKSLLSGLKLWRSAFERANLGKSDRRKRKGLRAVPRKVNSGEDNKRNPNSNHTSKQQLPSRHQPIVEGRRTTTEEIVYSEGDRRKLQKAGRHYRRGNDLFRQRLFDEAIREYVKAVMIRNSVVGTYDFDTASLYWNIGNCYNGKGDARGALMAHHRWLRIRRYLNHDVDKPGVMWIFGAMQSKGLSDEQLQCYDNNLKASIRCEFEADELRRKKQLEAAIEKYKESIDTEKKCFEIILGCRSRSFVDGKSTIIKVEQVSRPAIRSLS